METIQWWDQPYIAVIVIWAISCTLTAWFYLTSSDDDDYLPGLDITEAEDK
jgi:hypothetical protein